MAISVISPHLEKVKMIDVEKYKIAYSALGEPRYKKNGKKGDNVTLPVTLPKKVGVSMSHLPFF